MLYIPCYFYVRNITRSNALEYYQQKLEDGVRSLDTSLTALSNLQTLLNQDALYRMLGYGRSQIDSADLAMMRSSVRAYLLPYDMVAETGLTMGDDILFTRTRIYYQREQLTVDKYFSCRGLTTADYVRKLSGTFCVLPAMVFDSVDYGSYEAFTVAWRWSRSNDVYLFSTFPLKNVFALMADKGVLSSGYVSIKLGDTLIASSGTPLENDCELLTAKTSAVLLTVSVQIPNSYIEQDLKQLLRIVQFFLIAVALATAVWIAVCAVAAARPLNRITDALYDSKHLPSEPGGKGSLSDLADWIKKLDSRLTNYEDIISAQQENLRIHTLEKALYQGLYNQESREAFRNAYPRFPSHWRMALLQYGPEEAGLDDSRLTLLFTECLLKELSGAILLPTGNDTLLVILSNEEGEDPARALEALRVTMQERYGVLFSFTLSDAYDDPASLAGAYQQMEYESSTLPAASDAPRREKPPLSLQQLQTMYMALSCGDEKASLGLLQNAAAPLISDQDFFLSKHTYQMIANMLVTVKLESPCDLSDIPIPSFGRGEIGKLYTEELPHCFSRIANRIARQRKALTQDLDQSILSFINANLASPLLCISMVTDKFQISAPTLQKRLHAVTAQTFSAYVEDARMNKARQELRETDHTVQEISEDCGYTTPNSFYKAYKRRFREAPLSLRKGEKM
jgi:AraC-like DNA-binding protein